jgi:hypothetical protein
MARLRREIREPRSKGRAGSFSFCLLPIFAQQFLYEWTYVIRASEEVG